MNAFLNLCPHWREELGVLAQAVVAMVLGGLLGWERRACGKQAGLRTQMLVCLSTMLFVKLGQFLIRDSAPSFNPEAVRADPIHIIAAVATGISFLGAGTIFREGRQEHPQGLTTAASLLVTGSVGISVALGRHILAVGMTLLALLILHPLRKVEEKAGNPPK